jgi:hypothetical protein
VAAAADRAILAQLPVSNSGGCASFVTVASLIPQRRNPLDARFNGAFVEVISQMGYELPNHHSGWRYQIAPALPPSSWSH